MFPFGFVQLFSTAKLTHGVQKALFGSDWPFLTEIHAQQEWVNVIRTRTSSALQMTGLLEITDEDETRMLGTSAGIGHARCPSA